MSSRETSLASGPVWLRLKNECEVALEVIDKDSVPPPMAVVVLSWNLSWSLLYPVAPPSDTFSGPVLFSWKTKWNKLFIHHCIIINFCCISIVYVCVRGGTHKINETLMRMRRRSYLHPPSGHSEYPRRWCRTASSLH